jgi:hypothetical protein
MVDRVYKHDLSRLRATLEGLRIEFSGVDSKTDWVKLRIDPLLKHTQSLEQVLDLEEFSQESSRLRTGVTMFHSDLVYLRSNVKTLKEILQVEKRRLGPGRR